MTKLALRKSRLRFQTDSEVRSRGKLRPVMVEATADYASLYLWGTRKRFTLTYAQMYDLAAKLEANRVRAEKKAAKKGSR